MLLQEGLILLFFSQDPDPASRKKTFNTYFDSTCYKTDLEKKRIRIQPHIKEIPDPASKMYNFIRILKPA